MKNSARMHLAYYQKDSIQELKELTKEFIDKSNYQFVFYNL